MYYVERGTGRAHSDLLPACTCCLTQISAELKLLKEREEAAGTAHNETYMASSTSNLSSAFPLVRGRADRCGVIG